MITNTFSGSSIKESDTENEEGFIDIKSSSSKDTAIRSSTEFILTSIPEALKAFEERASFSLVGVSLIGYIIIAATGNLTNLKDLFFYLSFNILILIMYGLMKSSFTYFKFMKSKFYTLIILLLIILLAITNRDFIILLLKEFRHLMHKY